MSRLLLVEDEKDIQDLLLLNLKREGLDPVVASDGATAWAILQKQSFPLAILDWMLPGGVSGIELARLIRANPSHQSTAILMVTARAADMDIIAGLEAGADDYVSKPFEMPVLMARVRALLRRQRHQGSEPPQSRELFSVGELSLSAASHEVSYQGSRLELTPYEFRLLHALLRNAGRVLTRDRLINEVQGTGVIVVDRAIDTHIFGLRKKLGPAADYIETVRGVGYRIAPPVLKGSSH